MSNNVSKRRSKSGGPKMGKKGQKLLSKMGNQNFRVLHHKIITTLTFSKLSAPIEPTVGKILAGQKIIFLT